MKIKVITLKDIIKYVIKFSLIFGIIAILVHFFYDKKNVNSYFSFDAARFISSLRREIVLLKEENRINEYLLSKKNYISDTIGSEFSMFKTVATANSNSHVLGNKDERINQVAKEDNNSDEVADNSTISANSANAILQEAETGLPTEVLPSSIPDKTSYEIFGVKLRNESDYKLDEEIKDLDISFNKKDIIIFHTHTCESYTATEKNQYNSTGNYRTTDLNYSVARVGDELEKYLSQYGFSVIHDKSYHDYPAYNGSYNRSLVTVKKLLETYNNTDVVIDLHRDAIGDNTYAPKVKIGDDYCARIMFVIGTDGGGLTHDNWRDNLKFAMKVVQKGNELYPGLFKPIIVRNSRYNHHVSKAACIIEVGATGNTLEECLNSMKYLAKIYSEI